MLQTGVLQQRPHRLSLPRHGLAGLADGTFERMLRAAQARADAAGDSTGRRPR